MSVIKRLYAKIYRKYLKEDYLKKLTDRGFTVGKNLTLLQDVIIDDTHCWHISIGDDVTIAPRAHLLAHDASTKVHLGYTKIGKVAIGNRVFIGASAIIMPGVTVGDDAIIGAGSIVTEDVPAGTVVAGNPAKVVATIDTFIKKRTKELKMYPLFGEEYTMRKSVTEEMKNEMNRIMKDGYGYII